LKDEMNLKELVKQ